MLTLKNIIVSLCLLLSNSAFAQSELILPIISVYDGDTIETRLPLPPPLDKVSIRIRDVDTPEAPAESYPTTGKLGRAGCVAEAELALVARDKVRQISQGAPYMVVTDFEYDKYGGRILGKVSIQTIDVSTFLVNQNLAVYYSGDKKTHNWCQ